jgi:hypothetical protein
MRLLKGIVTALTPAAKGLVSTTGRLSVLIGRELVIIAAMAIAERAAKLAKEQKENQDDKKSEEENR